MKRGLIENTREYKKTVSVEKLNNAIDKDSLESEKNRSLSRVTLRKIQEREEHAEDCFGVASITNRSTKSPQQL